MSSVAASGPAIRGQRIRAIAASTVGTTIEWYDFFLYGTSAALVFPTVPPAADPSRAAANVRWRYG